jgi:hypothetical protein
LKTIRKHTTLEEQITGTKNTTILTVLLVFVVFQIWVTLGLAEERLPSSVIVEDRQDELVLEAEGKPLGKVLDEIRRKCTVEILGLERREKDLVTFSSKGGTRERELKRFLGHLGERNYAFEFVDDKLRRVLVFPEGKADPPSIPFPVNKDVVQKDFVTLPQVQEIIEGSQAELLNILEGDLVVEYDGITITDTQELIKETKKRKEYEQVEMVLVRDGEPLRISLRGGYIGVLIKTTKISEDELDKYYSGPHW